jgi:phosphatidylinositol-3-phosphatase
MGRFFLALFFAASSAFAGLNANSSVFVILMENHNWSSFKGSADAPYLNNTLLPMASYCDQYYNPPGLHPSEPNYLWLEAGTNFNVTDDNPPAMNHQASTAHFVTQLKNAGISWKTYQESIDGLSCPVVDNYPYAVRHNPFAFFDDVTTSVSPTCTSVMRPLTELVTDIANNTLAHYNFITPNVCGDGHDSCAPTSNTVKQTDDWLAANLPAILNSSAYQNNGVIIITWDEGEDGVDGPIGCVVLSPFAKGGGYHNGVRYTHSATLRTLQKIFGRTPLLAGAAAAPDLSDLFVNGAIPNGDSPSVTTTSASNVSGGNATFGGNFNPNGDQTQYWFEYGLTTSYGADTRSRSSDDAESYGSWNYGSNGGSGFGPITYREGANGGIYLETGGAKIDGAKSFGLYSSNGTQAADRQIINAKQAGTLNLSVRWNVNNFVAFSGFNLKSAQGGTFGANELISVGIKPYDGSQFGNNVIAVNGLPAINLGTTVLGQIVDFTLTYDGASGTFRLGAKLRSSAGYSYYSGNLKASNVTPAYLGFGNFNTQASGQTPQNIIMTASHWLIQIRPEMDQGSLPKPAMSPA